MSTSPADWYPDPTEAGRLRYWDGAAWTGHVSRDGAVTTDALRGFPPPAPAAPAPAPPPPPAAAGEGARHADGTRYPATPLGRAGLVIAAAGGVLAAVTSGTDVVEQPGLVSIEVTEGAWLGVAGTVACLAAAVAPWAWARLTGLAVAALFGLVFAFAVIGFRTSDDLIDGAGVSLLTGGVLLLVASVLFLAGTAIGLAGFRRPVRGPQPGAHGGDGKGRAALVLGIAGLLVPVLAPPAVGLGLMGIDDVRASEGRVGGRGLAIGGIVLGIVSLALWGVGVLLGMVLAEP